MRESVSSWTANTSEDQEEGVSEKPLIGPQRPGAVSQSGSGMGPTIGPSFKVRSWDLDGLQFFDLLWHCIFLTTSIVYIRLFLLPVYVMDIEFRLSPKLGSF